MLSDEVRAKEARALKARGLAPVLTRTRWLLLKRPAKVTDAELPRLVDLLHDNLRAVRSYLLREEFQYFWTVSPRASPHHRRREVGEAGSEADVRRAGARGAA